jgi:molecular chaperone IbpA
MRTYNDPLSFDTLAKGAIGFEPLFKRLQEMSEHLPKVPNYPPCNIKKIDDEHFVIEMAVAGFGKSNLDIELKEGVLTISGKVENDDSIYIYKGIADRAFQRQFTIADHVEVKNAELVNGMLKIFLERLIPEEEKPKKIDILDPFGVGETTKKLLNESVKAQQKFYDSLAM